MNVKAPYLPLADARAIIGTLGRSWEGSAWQKVAHDEGWNIFNLGPIPGTGDPLDSGIERYDEPKEHGCEWPMDFADDEAVVQRCQAKVAAMDDPTGTYGTALVIEHALNSMRYHTWGEAYVDSRCGPEVRA